MKKHQNYDFLTEKARITILINAASGIKYLQRYDIVY